MIDIHLLSPVAECLQYFGPVVQHDGDSITGQTELL